MKILLIPVDEFFELLDQRLKSVTPPPHKEVNESDDLLTRHDLAKMFGVSLVTINAWVKRGILIPHHINSRVYFFKSEVIKMIKDSH